MKKNTVIKILMSVLTVFMTGIHVRANTALTSWDGSRGGGVVTGDEECPIIVEHEDLHFEVPAIPSDVYPDWSHFTQYGQRFTASYTFVNPSDTKAEVLLSFPFGDMPSYSSNLDRSLYTVTADDRELETVQRYTYTGRSFSVADDLARLRDGYCEDPFFAPDLPVRTYTIQFHLNAKALEGNVNARVRADIPRSEKTKIMADWHFGGGTFDSEHIEIILNVEQNDKVSYTVFGEDPGIVWSQTSTPSEDLIEVLEVREMTYNEYAQERKPGEVNISDTDWYNALTDSLNFNAESDMILHQRISASALMGWLQYKLTFEPGQTIVNKVSAPLYPSLTDRYEEWVLEYDYLLTPASTWKSFGSLDITIDTPMYLLECRPDKAEETDGGYAMHFEALPEEELYFKLSAVKDPQVRANSYGTLILGILAGAAVLFILLVVLVIIIIRRIIKRHKNRR